MSAGASPEAALLQALTQRNVQVDEYVTHPSRVRVWADASYPCLHCMELFHSGEVVVLPACNHIVCHDCVSSWVRESTSFLSTALTDPSVDPQLQSNLSDLLSIPLSFCVCRICFTPTFLQSVNHVHYVNSRPVTVLRWIPPGAKTVGAHAVGVAIPHPSFSADSVFENQRRLVVGSFARKHLLKSDFRGPFSTDGGDPLTPPHEVSKDFQKGVPNTSWLWASTFTLDRHHAGGRVVAPALLSALLWRRLVSRLVGCGSVSATAERRDATAAVRGATSACAGGEGTALPLSADSPTRAMTSSGASVSEGGGGESVGPGASFSGAVVSANAATVNPNNSFASRDVGGKGVRRPHSLSRAANEVTVAELYAVIGGGGVDVARAAPLPPCISDGEGWAYRFNWPRGVGTGVKSVASAAGDVAGDVATTAGSMFGGVGRLLKGLADSGGKEKEKGKRGGEGTRHAASSAAVAALRDAVHLDGQVEETQDVLSWIVNGSAVWRMVRKAAEAEGLPADRHVGVTDALQGLVLQPVGAASDGSGDSLPFRWANHNSTLTFVRRRRWVRVRIRVDAVYVQQCLALLSPQPLGDAVCNDGSPRVPSRDAVEPPPSFTPLSVSASVGRQPSEGAPSPSSFPSAAVAPAPSSPSPAPSSPGAVRGDPPPSAPPGESAVAYVLESPNHSCPYPDQTHPDDETSALVDSDSRVCDSRASPTACGGGLHSSVPCGEDSPLKELGSAGDGTSSASSRCDSSGGAADGDIGTRGCDAEGSGGVVTDPSLPPTDNSTLSGAITHAPSVEGNVEAAAHHAQPAPQPHPRPRISTNPFLVDSTEANSRAGEDGFTSPYAEAPVVLTPPSGGTDMLGSSVATRGVATAKSKLTSVGNGVGSIASSLGGWGRRIAKRGGVGGSASTGEAVSESALSARPATDGGGGRGSGPPSGEVLKSTPSTVHSMHANDAVGHTPSAVKDPRSLFASMVPPHSPLDDSLGEGEGRRESAAAGGGDADAETAGASHLFNTCSSMPPLVPNASLFVSQAVSQEGSSQERDGGAGGGRGSVVRSMVVPGSSSEDDDNAGDCVVGGGGGGGSLRVISWDINQCPSRLVILMEGLRVGVTKGRLPPIPPSVRRHRRVAVGCV